MRHLAAALCLLSAPAFAQSNPSFITGQIPTAAQWNSYFGKKADVTGGTINNGVLNSVTINGSLGGSPTVGGVWTASNATLSGFAIAGGTLSGTFTGTNTTITTTTPNAATLDNGLLILQAYNGTDIGQAKGIATWTASVRIGSETSTDHFCKIFNCAVRSLGQYNNFESVVTTVAGTISNQVAAITATMDDFGGRGVIPIIAQGIAEVSNSAIWGINTVHQDSPNSSGVLTNVRLEDEFDYFVHNSTTTVRGILIALDATAAPSTSVNLIGANCSLFAGSPFHWNACFFSGNGGADTALVVGSTVVGNPASTGNISQQVSYLYTDNTTAATQRSVNVIADPTLAGATGVLMRFESSYSGKVNLTLDNLASLGGINAAGNGYIELAKVDGSNRGQFGGGGTTNLLTYNGGTAATWGPGLEVGSPNGGMPSAGAVNAQDLQINGNSLSKAPRILGQACTAAITGDTSPHNMATVTIPAGSMGTNGALQVETLWVGNNADAKTVQVALSTVSGSGGTNYLNVSFSNVADHDTRTISNNQSAAVQVGYQPNTPTPFGSGTSAAASTIDTTSISYVNLTGTLSNGADNMYVCYTVAIKVP